MFLQNDRGLGVKNGTLGTIKEVGTQSTTVRTDDGREVAFDTKDYAHIDHGYAATIHKAQGMTVNHAHVLATPGMDSHSAYVAMSRHREGLALHERNFSVRYETSVPQQVGMAGSSEPALVVIRYEPKKSKKNAKQLALVGKGLTFDSGGISIKPGDKMWEMKADMSGAAAVLGFAVGLRGDGGGVRGRSAGTTSPSRARVGRLSGGAGAAAGGRVAEVPGHVAGEEGRARESTPRARGLRRLLARRNRDRDVDRSKPDLTDPTAELPLS